MIGTRDLAVLVEATGAAGAKLVLSGDTRQLARWWRGAPMRLLVPGAGREPDGRDPAAAWTQRSGGGVDAGGERRLRRRGRTASALEAYDRGGAITWGRDREATIAALVDAYAESRLDPEGAQRTRRWC